MKGVVNNQLENLVLFLHIHKSGGTSIAQMFHDAGKLFHDPHVNGNPWTQGCRDIIEFWNFDARQLKEWAQAIRAKGVEFIACEWDFLSRESRYAWTEFSLITCMRDSFSRIVSDYQSMGGDQRWGDIRRWYGGTKLTWSRESTDRKFPVTHNLPNHYVRLLNGLGTDPDARLTEENLTYAKYCLELFDSVLILEKPESFRLLNKYGVIGPIVHVNQRKRLVAGLPEDFKSEFVADNEFDYKLYKYGLILCEVMLGLSNPATSVEAI